MRVALLAPLIESVPPLLYGGTERVVSWLTEALVARGHDVTLFASGDSQTRAELVPVVPRALRLEGNRLRDDVALHLMQAELCRRRARDFDVVHTHIDHLAFSALRGADVPVVATLHGRLDLEGLAPLHQLYRGPLVSISDAQRAPMPRANWVATIHHGLPVADYTYSAQGGDFVLFLGRISPEKRPDLAIRVARAAGVPIVLAAKVDAADQRYHDDVVAPLLRAPGVEFVGEVDDAQKIELLGRARALLFPIAWPEPFGLVMIEAMACGTPVVATRWGSIPEVIEDGVTGRVCDDEEALVRALAEVRSIDRAACRLAVERRFSSARMAASYEDVYARLTSPR